MHGATTSTPERIVISVDVMSGDGGLVFAGRVGSYVHFTGKIAVRIEVDGEASDDLLKDLCMHVSAASPAPLGVTEEEVDALLNAAGAFERTEIGVERALDSGDIERERGITITSKPTALQW